MTQQQKIDILTSMMHTIFKICSAGFYTYDTIIVRSRFAFQIEQESRSFINRIKEKYDIESSISEMHEINRIGEVPIYFVYIKIKFTKEEYYTDNYFND